MNKKSGFIREKKIFLGDVAQKSPKWIVDVARDSYFVRAQNDSKTWIFYFENQIFSLYTEISFGRANEDGELVLILKQPDGDYLKLTDEICYTGYSPDSFSIENFAGHWDTRPMRKGKELGYN